MNSLFKQMELTFWNIAIPMLTRSQALRSVIQKSIGACQEKKIGYQAAVVTVIACAGFAAGLLAYSVSLLLS